MPDPVQRVIDSGWQRLAFMVARLAIGEAAAIARFPQTEHARHSRR